MKKVILITLALLLLMAVGVSTAFAGEGDPQPGVTTWEGVSCGVPAGQYGNFSTNSWWYATYSNGVGVLKCSTHLSPGQVPPADVTKVAEGFDCNTPNGLTSDSYTKVFPSGRVILICKD